MTFEEHVNKILEMFPNIPNPEHEPKKFIYYVKLYKYLVSQKNIED
jgi:hypothetical protein